MRLVAISDTHGFHRQIDVPDGDILVHCGDSELRDLRDIYLFNYWLGSLPHKHKILIGL